MKMYAIRGKNYNINWRPSCLRERLALKFHKGAYYQLVSGNDVLLHASNGDATLAVVHQVPRTAGTHKDWWDTWSVADPESGFFFVTNCDFEWQAVEEAERRLNYKGGLSGLQESRREVYDRGYPRAPEVK